MSSVSSGSIPVKETPGTIDISRITGSARWEEDGFPDPRIAQREGLGHLDDSKALDRREGLEGASHVRHAEPVAVVLDDGHEWPAAREAPEHR